MHTLFQNLVIVSQGLSWTDLKHERLLLQLMQSILKTMNTNYNVLCKTLVPLKLPIWNKFKLESCASRCEQCCNHEFLFMNSLNTPSVIFSTSFNVQTLFRSVKLIQRNTAQQIGLNIFAKFADCVIILRINMRNEKWGIYFNIWCFLNYQTLRLSMLKRHSIRIIGQ